MPDSGWFPDYNGPPRLHDNFRWIYEQSNSSAGVSRSCFEAQQDGEHWKCMFAEHGAPHIRTPIFALQGIYDWWAVLFDLGVDPLNYDAINSWGQRVRAEIVSTVLEHPGNGAFLDSCWHHTRLYNDGFVQGSNAARAFMDWYMNGSQGLANRGFYEQGERYPCEACCHSA